MADSKSTLLLSVFVASLIGGLSGYAAAAYKTPDFDLRARPRIAVVSYADVLANKSADQVADAMSAVDAKAVRLSDAGFIVLNDNAVVASPADLAVPGDSDHE